MKPGVTCQKLVCLNKISPVIEKSHLFIRKQDEKPTFTNNGCFALMQHAGMKSNKEKASVRLAFTRKDSILCKEKETVEPSPFSSSEQSRTEIQCSETSQEDTKQVSVKDFFMKKTKQTNQPQMVDMKPESKDNESVLTVQDQDSKAETLWALNKSLFIKNLR